MKKILIIQLLFITSNLFGQQLIENKVLTFRAPKDVATIKNGIDKANSVQGQKRIMAIVRANSLNGQKYFGEGTIKFFHYTDTILSVQPNYLEKTKKMFDEMATINGKKVAGYSSVIKNSYNCDALIIESQIEDYIRYSIFSVNKFRNKIFSVTVVVSKPDSIAGDKAVIDLLKSIKFK